MMTMQTEGSTSPIPLLTSTNAKRIELSRGGRSLTSLCTTVVTAYNVITSRKCNKLLHY